MKKKKILVCLLTASVITSSLVSIFVINRNFGDKLTLDTSAAAQTRTITFDGSHRNVTTANGNKFVSYWIKSQSGCNASSSSQYVYLQGTATWSSYSDSYSISYAEYALKGEKYNFAKITKIEVNCKITTSWTDLEMYFVNSDGSRYTGICYPLLSTTTNTSNSKNYSTTISGSTARRGLSFLLTHSGGGGGSNDTMKAYIYSVKITYSC